MAQAVNHPIDMDAVARAVSSVLDALDELKAPLVRANVSGVYTTGGRHGKACEWRVCVGLNDCRVFVPSFRQVEDAEAYREAVGQALDRAM